MKDLTPLITEATDLAKRGGSAQEIARVACRLAGHISNAQEALDPLKALLRDLASTQRGDESHVHYDTDAGSVSVTFPSPRFKARKGTDWDVVRHVLGDCFDTYFVTNVRYDARKDIDAVIKTRKASGEVPDVLKAIERAEPTPRVGFKPT